MLRQPETRYTGLAIDSGGAMSQIILNLLAIFVCALLAHLFPEATFLGAYAILGPAHYLTEISWLHDRKYFVGRPGLWITVALVVLMVMLVRPHTPAAAGLLFALIGGLIASGIAMPFSMMALTVIGSAFVGSAGVIFGWVAVIAVAILIPTLLHVFAFTAMFMVNGALRTRRWIDWLPPLALALATASFLLLPTVDLGHGRFLNTVTQGFSNLFAQLSGPGRSIELRLVGFVGFAYAYHYANWFLKTGLLGWHRVSQWRLVMIASAWLVMMYAYTQDILLGLLISLPLSLGHVLLELPLNVMTARRLLGMALLRKNLSAS